jgi:DNA polymerase III sliding clamp (beta) subunit (PCNA family)
MTTIKFDVKELSNVITIMNKMQQETGRVTQLAFFKFSNNVAEVFATNWEIKVDARIECDMEGDDCNIAVDKKSMLNIINEIKKDNDFVTIEINGINMVIRDEHNKVFKLMGDIDSEFGIFEPEDIPLQQFSTKEFTEALNHVIYATPKKNNYTSAVDTVHIVDGKIFYCCDNFRLAKYELTKPCGISDNTQITTKAAKFLIDAVNILEESGKIGVKDKIMAIEIGNYRIEVMCTDYLLPEYELALAEEWENIISIETKKLVDALKQVKRTKNKYVYIETVQDKPNTIKLSSCDSFGNISMSIEIEAKIHEMKNSKKAFDTQFLIDALKPVRDRYVKIYYPSNNENWIDIFADDERYRVMIMEVVLM